MSIQEKDLIKEEKSSCGSGACSLEKSVIRKNEEVKADEQKKTEKSGCGSN